MADGRGEWKKKIDFKGASVMDAPLFLNLGSGSTYKPPAYMFQLKAINASRWL